ncbi:uncharacterized protein LOC103706027 isoform X2 [Phoenix dactylifera]|uniref:Uncharacterized protein LOC103706027 isoform X2 n=1 Tax=Phoenix dactylifera TaxID=42345 RepID=A0A8B8Z8M4_PHODC|nr:uncharacterized protein LOC103706027 isoform X2 [Phoenix dactylifera]
MALMAMTTIGPRVPFQRIRAPFPRVMVSMHAKTSVSFNKTVDSVAIGNAWEGPYQSLMFSCGRDFTCLSWPTFATGSGLEASITDQKKSDLSLDNVKIVVESRDDDKIHVSLSPELLISVGMLMFNNIAFSKVALFISRLIMFPATFITLNSNLLFMCNIECSNCITTCLKYIVFPCLITSRYFALVNVKLLLRILLSEKSLCKGA